MVGFGQGEGGAHLTASDRVQPSFDLVGTAAPDRRAQGQTGLNSDDRAQEAIDPGNVHIDDKPGRER